MAAIWVDSRQPSFLGLAPSFAFHDLPEIHAIAPAAYEVARLELQMMDEIRGAAWNVHNAELAHSFYMSKRAWWLSVV